MRRVLIGIAVCLGVAGLVLGWWELDRQLRAEALARATEAVREVGFVTHRARAPGKRVYLTGDKVTDQKILSIIEHLETLEPAEVDLVNCPVTDEGIEGLKRLTKVKAIYIHQTKATDEGVKALQEALPDSAIHITEPDPVASGLVSHNVFRHALNRLAYAPSGDFIAAGDGHGFLHVWNAKTGAVVHRGKAHEKWLFALTFSPDGKLLATGGGDHVVRLWNTDSWELSSELKGHSDDVHAVAFAPNGQTLLSAGDDDTIRTWNLVNQKYSLDRTLTGHTDSITSLAISADGQLFASGSRDRTIRLWNLALGAFVRELRGHMGDVMQVAFHPNSARLASASYDARVILWDTYSGSPQRRLSGHDSRVYSVAFGPDGKQIASCAENGTLIVWSEASGQILRQVKGDLDMSHVAWDTTGGELAVSSAEGRIALWNVNSQRPSRLLWSRYPAPPDEIAFVEAR